MAGTSGERAATRPQPPVEIELRGPLSVLPADEARELLSHAVPRTYEPGAMLIRQGDTGDRVHVVLEGRVRVVHTTEDGHGILLALRGPGDTLGELAALDPGPHIATVGALETVKTFDLPAERFVAFVCERPPALFAILRLVIRRLRESDRRLVDTRAEDTLTRLARHLLELGARYGVATEDGLDLDVPLTQEQLASWVGASREGVSIALRTLRERGAILTGRMRITLVDVDALRAVATGGG